MIGNDIICLASAHSSFLKPGYLAKCFTTTEQQSWLNVENKFLNFHIMWSQKEAAYKIWNRKTGLRKFNPVFFETDLINQQKDCLLGKVNFHTSQVFTYTTITNEFIHTIALTSTRENFDIEIKINESYYLLNVTEILQRNKNGQPVLVISGQINESVSLSHDGKYYAIAFIK